jgi:hypothetical protein
MTKRIFPAAVAAAFLCVPAAFSEEVKPQLVRAIVFDVKPNMYQEFQEALKDSLEAYKKAGIPWRSVFVGGMFGNMSSVLLVYPLTNFAQLDGGGPLVKQWGERGYEQYLNRIRKCVNGTNAYAELLRPDLSIMSDSKQDPKLVTVTIVKVTPGKDLAFESLVKSTVLPAFKKAGIKDVWLHKNVLGSSPQTYTVVSPGDSYAEFDKGPLLERAMGKEGAEKYRQSLYGIVSEVTFEVMRHVPELSY